ncbi:MAG TPA: DUF1015 domain-containing protein [Candidatus Hydrogenedentes bacterium]|nr:DUF1015 domain-containing protein [Candidatus Hydrogenedentota bacterium]HRT20103.1 DUF1015 domain-containing protein [Candidatus Hydrogenedentota bacterium]HRT64833.1 DUF1015 domain-containing protein [Candidatus Hydrogenedentota bacterium]
MPEIQGFYGLRFNPDQTGPLEAVVTPPYDVISPAQRVELAAQSPYSMVHVSLPEPEAGETPYDAAARILDRWRADGVLLKDGAKSFYVLEQVFESGGRQRIRRGFFALARLPEPGERSILGHEQTFARTVEDRMRLIEATKANLEPVFVLYADPGGKVGECLTGAVAQRPPDMTARTMDGVLQRVWRVGYDPCVTQSLLDSRLYIADGHHRFRTSCAYRDACRAKGMGEGPHDFIMMGFVAIDDPGLVIEPTHRLLKPPGEFDTAAFLQKLALYFDCERVGDDLPQSVERESQCAIGFVAPGGRWLLRLHETDRAALLGTDRGPAWRDLDVAVLHRGIIERIMGWPADTPFAYERDAGKAVACVENGEYGAAFLLRSPRAEQIQACAESGEPMPHKSTYFFPKLPSGMVLYALD